MPRTILVGGALAAVLVLLAIAVGRRTLEQTVKPAAAAPAAAVSPAAESASAAAEAGSYEGFLYGRVTTVGGTAYEGRLRWGGGEEASWGDYFHGFKKVNPWASHVPPERLKESRPVEIFGVEIARRESRIDLGRPFVARFGDIVRIEARGRDLRVRLKSGTVFHLDRFAADDLGDGLRVWDPASGVVDLDERRIRAVELLPTARLGADVPARLHGNVQTRQGSFTGFVQWNREEGVGTDELDGRTAEGERSVRFDAIRSIARHSREGSLVTLSDGREIVLSGTREVGQGNRGIFVEDRRYGRVLVSWEAFERLDLTPGGSGPGYDDFPPGRALTGSVTTRAGRRLAGRLVYDLDESETTETLDAPAQGVTYTIPFGLIATIVPPGSEVPGGDVPGVRRARVRLHGGEELLLEAAGDLGESNAGMLIFAGDRERPEHVPWADVERVDLERPPAMYPPGGLPDEGR